MPDALAGGNGEIGAVHRDGLRGLTSRPRWPEVSDVLKSEFAMGLSSNALKGLIVAAIALGWASAATAADTDAAISALLRQKTQEFSDAGQRNDGAAMGALLDDRVVFFNEGGDMATRADMASGTPTPPSPSVSTVMTIEDWHCEVHGNVAVASFIDDQQRVAYGERFHARYRSVETWLNEGGTWRMIGSETIALGDDPRAIALTAAELDQYVGTYKGASGQLFTFSRAGTTLMAATGDGAPTAQSAEARDVFFTPGRVRFRKVFERDAGGKVIGFFARREGHDTHFARVG